MIKVKLEKEARRFRVWSKWLTKEEIKAMNLEIAKEKQITIDKEKAIIEEEKKQAELKVLAEKVEEKIVNERSLIDTMEVSELAKKMKSKTWRMNNLYYIVNELGETIEFEFNYIQKRIWVEKSWRNVILKYRQGGVSTLFIIDELDDVLFWQNNTTNYFITHRQDLLDEFFKKAKFTYDSMYPKIRAMLPKPKTDNSNELYWTETNNTLKIALDIRWKTPSKIHISEFAWMTPENQKKLFIAMNQFRETSIAIESTANGLGDVFYKVCYNSLEWIGQYKLLFYPFDIEIRNEMDVPQNYVFSQDDILFGDNYLSKYKKWQRERKLYWRRIQIDTAKSLWDEWEKTFNQENPITIEHAFISSWSMVFDLDWEFKIQESYKEIEWFKLFEHPTDELVIGVDVSEWWVRWDYSAISARRKDWKLAFQFKGKVSETILAKKLDFILEYSEEIEWKKKQYRWVIFPENNSGLAFINECKKYKWFNYMLKSRKIDSTTEENIQQKYGFRTTQQSKDLIIREYRWALYRNEIWISRELMSEIRTYQYDKNNRPNAIYPNHDDLLMADMIALNWILHESWNLKYKPSREEVEDMTYLQRLRYKITNWLI